MENFISLKEYAAREGISYPTARSHFAKGLIPGAAKNGRTIQIPAEFETASDLKAPARINEILQSIRNLKEKKDKATSELSRLQKEESAARFSFNSLSKKKETLKKTITRLEKQEAQLQDEHKKLEQEVFRLNEKKKHLDDFLLTAPLEKVMNYLQRNPESFKKIAAIVSSSSVQEKVSQALGTETIVPNNKDQLQILEKQILEERFKQVLFQKEKKLSFWYTGCTNGMEIYSIAVICAEMLEKKNAAFMDFHILASDASTQDMKVAQDAVYPESSLFSVPMNIRKKYFLRNRKRQAVKVGAHIREKISFRELSFLDSSFTLRERMDVIICRNALHLLDAETLQRVLDNFTQQLKPEGFLLIQNDLDLSGMTSLQELVPGVYQRRARESQQAGWA